MKTEIPAAIRHGKIIGFVPYTSEHRFFILGTDNQVYLAGGRYWSIQGSIDHFVFDVEHNKIRFDPHSTYEQVKKEYS